MPATACDNRIRVADFAWPTVGQRARSGAMLAVPLGSTEQHGPHLPLSVDTDIAVALCERLASMRADVLVAPPLAYGSSGEHAGFPGTLSIGQDALELLVVELGRSASETFDHLLLVSAHGGNAAAVARATKRLRSESYDVHLFVPQWKGDPHAGRSETSMLLALTSDLVDMARAVPGDTRELAEIFPLLRTGGVKAVSSSGILGDPTGATAEEGETLLQHLTTALADEVARWRGGARSIACL